MPIWSAATITRFVGEAEQEIARTIKCIINRTALDITASVNTYTLPSDLFTITRLTWKGKKILPASARDYHNLNNVQQARSEPLFYIFNQQGLNTIKFFPTPDTAIATIGTNLFGSEIENRVIVEYYQLPDSVTVFLPLYVRRRLVKYYVLMKCFSQEGKGQNLKSAAKMKTRYDFYMTQFRKIYAGTFIAKLNKLGGGNKSSALLAPPRLPYTFGESGEY